EDDGPACQESGPAGAFVAGGEEALDHQLFGSVAGGGEEAAADDASPEAVATRKEFRGRPEAEVENLEFAKGFGDGGDVRPSTGDLVQDGEQAYDGSRDVEEHLNDVGPDYGSHSALVGVENRQTNDESNGRHFSGPENNSDYN